MQSIIDNTLENLKKECTKFFSGIPSIAEVEEFTWTKLKRVAAELTEAYAREADKALYEDRAGRRGWSWNVGETGVRY